MKEALRIRVQTYGMISAFWFFFLGLVCAPWLKEYRWAIWPCAAVYLIGMYFGWKMYRAWKQLEREYQKEVDQFFQDGGHDAEN